VSKFDYTSLLSLKNGQEIFEISVVQIQGEPKNRNFAFFWRKFFKNRMKIPLIGDF
jgi:hypothetical protein